MIPAALMPIYIDMAYDAGRCSPWMIEMRRIEVEQAIQALDSPPLWQSYLKGVKSVEKKGISGRLCQRLERAAAETRREIAEIMAKLPKAEFGDVPADGEPLIDTAPGS